MARKRIKTIRFIALDKKGRTIGQPIYAKNQKNAFSVAVRRKYNFNRIEPLMQ